MNRGKSLFGSAIDQNYNILKDQIQQKQYSRILQDLKTRPQTLKKFVAEYRRAVTQQDQHRIYEEYRREQRTYKRFRQQLKDEFQQIKDKNSDQETEYNYVRNELIHSIKQQMNIDLQMNQQIQRNKKQKQAQKIRWQNLQGRTPRVQNALDDIMQKTNEILELEASIKECLDLLEIIGVLVKEQGDKIQIVEDEVRNANECIKLAQKQINIAKLRMEKSTRKKCCVIIIGLIAIVLILVVLYGFVFKNI